MPPEPVGSDSLAAMVRGAAVGEVASAGAGSPMMASLDGTSSIAAFPDVTWPSAASPAVTSPKASLAATRRAVGGRPSLRRAGPESNRSAGGTPVAEAAEASPRPAWPVTGRAEATKRLAKRCAVRPRTRRSVQPLRSRSPLSRSMSGLASGTPARPRAGGSPVVDPRCPTQGLGSSQFVPGEAVR